MGYSETQQTALRYHLKAAFQSERVGNLPIKLTDAAMTRRRREPSALNVAAASERRFKSGTSPRITRWRQDQCREQTGRRLRYSEAIEDPMATRQDRRIVETPTEARQAEPGPSVLALLTVSVGLAMLILGVVWFVFFRT
jgi:hypothetical protein